LQRSRTSARGASNTNGSGDLSGRVLSTIRQHPVSALAIGAGLTWMLLGHRMVGGSSRSGGQRTGGRGRLGNLGETFGESFTGAARGSRKTVHDGLVTIGEYAQEGATSVGGAIREGAGAVGRGARRALTSTQETLRETLNGHPIAVCAAALAAGVTAGVLLPSTRRERRAIGPASQAVAQRVLDAGSNLVSKGRRVASRAVKTVNRESRREGITPKQLGKKVGRVASKTKDVVTP